MANISAIDMLSNAQSTLQYTSRYGFASALAYMVSSQLQVIDFDQVKDEYARSLSVSQLPKSCDALYIEEAEEEWYLIEFKSGVITNSKYELRQKLYDSLLVLSDVIGEGISFMRQHLRFVLVYDASKNPAENGESVASESTSLRKLKKYFIEEKAGGRFIEFGFSFFEGLYLKQVYTMTVDEFEETFVSKWSI